MTSNKIQILRGLALQHGKALDNLPESKSKINLTPLGNGGALLSASAASALVALFRAEDDLVVVDRSWLRNQLLCLGVADGRVDLLLDNIREPVHANTPGLTFLSAHR